MKNNKLINTFTAIALITAFTAAVNAAETTKPESAAPTTSTTTTTPPSNGENSTGECWVWPNCIVLE